MKLALLLALINPAIGGVLLIGARGTGKTTAVRSLLDLLPDVQRSNCFYGCTTEDIEAGGIETVCPDCAKKYQQGIPLESQDRVRLVELPLNAQLEDVIGRLDDRPSTHQRLRLKRGILAQSDQNLLYVDEVNLLSNEIIDAILDAAANGSYTVKRGAISATYRARLTLIGAMNPEEGDLRPQIMDRFGLRVVIHGLTNTAERIEAYQRVQLYRRNPHLLVSQFAQETEQVRQEIKAARQLLPQVTIPQSCTHTAIEIIRKLKIDSLRAEISLLEASRAHAAADGRCEVNLDDIQTVAPLALRLRQSPFMIRYLKSVSTAEKSLESAIRETIHNKEKVNG
ncbi:MAG: magnesium chelatase [Anaerolineae bacterium]|nr:magnesium chelatase [Anaerolineae bacterium]